MGIELDIPALVLIAAATALYVRAVIVLRRRGYDVPFWQQVSWHGGMVLTAAALLGPLDHLAEDLVSAHMAQHLLIADLAAPFLLVGLRTPVFVFFLPRPVLVPLARQRALRRAFRFVRRPLVALPLFLVVLYGWHIGFLFEGALRSDWLHVLQHESFVVASLLVWWAAIEPKRRRLPGELWKAGYILGTRVVSMFLGMAFLVARTPFYGDFYGDRAREHGLTPLEDQQIAGGLMMSLDILIMLFALAFFFWRAAEDHDRRAAEERRAAVT